MSDQQTTPPKQEPPKQEKRLELDARGLLDFQAILDHMPQSPDYITDVEVLLIVQICEYHRVNWAAAARPVLDGSGKPLAGQALDSAEVWGRDPQNFPKRITVVYRVRPSIHVLNNGSTRRPTLIPDIDILRAHQLVGELKRRNADQLQNLIELAVTRNA